MAEEIRYKKKKTRLTERYQQPSESLVRIFIGIEVWKHLIRLKEMLRERHDVGHEVEFPFSNEYDWSFRYSHKKSLLLYVFFEEGGFYCTISISDEGTQEVDPIFDELLPEIQASWFDRYACGIDGGWLNRSVISDEGLPDLIRLVGIKIKPKRIGSKNA